LISAGYLHKNIVFIGRLVSQLYISFQRNVKCTRQMIAAVPLIWLSLWGWPENEITTHTEMLKSTQQVQPQAENL